MLASDGKSGRTIGSFALTVRPDPTNSVPVARTIPKQTVTEVDPQPPPPPHHHNPHLAMRS